MFSIASADRPTIRGTRWRTNAALEGSLIAMLASGMILPSASPIIRAAKASRNGSRCGASVHLIQAKALTTRRIDEIASNKRNAIPSRWIPSTIWETPAFLTVYAKSSNPRAAKIIPSGANFLVLLPFLVPSGILCPWVSVMCGLIDFPPIMHLKIGNRQCVGFGHWR